MTNCNYNLLTRKGIYKEKKMSVTYDFRNCKNNAKHLQEYSYYICSYMISIGMDEITEKNYTEVYARICILEISSLNREEPWFNLDMARDLIGAKFGGRHIYMGESSKAKWSARMLKYTIQAVKDLESKKDEVA